MVVISEIVISLLLTGMYASLTHGYIYPVQEDGSRKKSVYRHVADCGLIYPAVVVYAWIAVRLVNGIDI